MALKKKGTPEKIEIVSDLEKFKKLINKAIKAGDFPITLETKKDKKEKK